MGTHMHREVYRRLRSHFHKHPLGFPETEDEVELRILEELFTEKEAEMTLQLTPKPEAAKSISHRLQKDFREVELLLERMANKGQIMTLGEKDSRAYLLVPYVPGTWEFQVNRMTKGFAEDVEAYYPSQAREMYSSATPPVRVVPVEKHVQGALKVFPFEMASQIVRGAKKIALSDCICRKHKKRSEKVATGHTNRYACTYPRWPNSLSSGAGAKRPVWKMPCGRSKGGKRPASCVPRG